MKELIRSLLDHSKLLYIHIRCYRLKICDILLSPSLYLSIDRILKSWSDPGCIINILGIHLWLIEVSVHLDCLIRRESILYKLMLLLLLLLVEVLVLVLIILSSVLHHDLRINIKVHIIYVLLNLFLLSLFSITTVGHIATSSSSVIWITIDIRLIFKFPCDW
jgi:hypothetical protein